MAHEVETMMSARNVLPWHFNETGKDGRTKILAHAPTAAEAIEAAQLDWRVSLRPVYTKIEEDGKKAKYEPIAGKHSVTRDSDGQVFSVVGGSYKPLQNQDAFTFMDSLADEGLEYETAGALRGGSIVFLTAKVPRTMMVGGKDAHELYLFLRNAHDGRNSVRVGITPIRIVCKNTMDLAMGSGLKRSWAVTHNTTMEGRLQEAREALDLTWRYVDAWEERADELFNQEMTNKQMERFLTEVVDPLNATQAAAAFDTMTAMLKDKGNITVHPYANTAWGAFNVVGEYFEWRKPRTTESRVMGNFVGVPLRMRDRALALLSA